MKVYDNVAQLVGNTPLMELKNIEKELGLKAKVLAKLEMFNPAGSAKDRVALNMIIDAEESGRLLPGGTIIEPTSGNTGIALAAIGCARGYRVIIVMPDTMSQERRLLVKAYGAELVLTPGSAGMAGCIERAEALSREIEGSIIAGQFDNPANPAAHYKSTGPEIWRDTEGRLDIYVAGIGTGGCLSGTGKYLKERNPEIKVIGFEPAASPLITKGAAGKHDLQGIGANFIPDNLDRRIYDEILTISDEEGYSYGRMLAAREGLLAGITSGACLCCGVKLAQRPENEGKTIVCLLVDTGARYLSTKMFEKL